MINFAPVKSLRVTLMCHTAAINWIITQSKWHVSYLVYYSYHFHSAKCNQINRMNTNQHKPSHSAHRIRWNSVVIMMFRFPSNRTYSTLFFCLRFFLNGRWWLQDWQQTSLWLKSDTRWNLRPGRKNDMCVTCSRLKIHPVWNVSPPLAPPALPWHSLSPHSSMTCCTYRKSVSQVWKENSSVGGA